jgi:hypothetical protein
LPDHFLAGIPAPQYSTPQANQTSTRRNEASMGNRRWLGSSARASNRAIWANDREESTEEENETWGAAELSPVWRMRVILDVLASCILQDINGALMAYCKLNSAVKKSSHLSSYSPPRYIDTVPHLIVRGLIESWTPFSLFCQGCHRHRPWRWGYKALSANDHDRRIWKSNQAERFPLSNLKNLLAVGSI